MKNPLAFFNRFPTFESFYDLCKKKYSTVDGGFSFVVDYFQNWMGSFEKTKYCHVFDFPVEEYRLKTFCQYFYNRMRFLYGIETVDTSTDIKTFFAGNEDYLQCNFFYTNTMVDLGLTLIILENPSKYYLVVAVDHYKNENGSHNLYHFDEPFCSSFSQAWISNEVKSILNHAKSNLMPQIVR